jgi:hypothetical protein
MHRARRSQCKDWHNPEWRDRVLAVISWLEKEATTICVPVGEEAKLEVSTQSVDFVSPVPMERGPLVDCGMRAARRVEHRSAKKNLEPWDDFEWGMINGILSTLRWA